MHWFNSEILYGCHKHSKILTHIYVRRSMAAIPVLYQVVHSHQRCHYILIPHISVANFPSKQCHHELDLGTLETNKTYKNKTTTAASCLVLGTIGGCQWVKSTLLLQYVMSLSVAEIITAAHKHHWKSNTVETRKGVVAHSSSLFGGPYLLRSCSFFAFLTNISGQEVFWFCHIYWTGCESLGVFHAISTYMLDHCAVLMVESPHVDSPWFSCGRWTSRLPLHNFTKLHRSQDLVKNCLLF